MATSCRVRWAWATALALSTVLTPPAPVRAQPAARRPGPAAPAGIDPARLAAIDEVVARAIAGKQLPGAVVVVGRGDTVLYRRRSASGPSPRWPSRCRSTPSSTWRR